MISSLSLRAFAMTGVALSVALGPATPAAADSGLVGGLVGGIIGGVIVNEANRNRRAPVASRRTVRTTPGISSAARTQNRETQVALNYFGFPVGAPDGALGARSRSAIADYQATLGYPPTGELNGFERDLLVTSYYRAQSGGGMQGDPRATLLSYRDERLGVPSGAAVTAAAPPQAPATAESAMPGFGSTMAAAEAPASTLPSFLGQGAAQVSLASTCNRVSLVTNSNGGFVTEASMTDPGFALSEQFCLARTYAMAQGEEAAQKIAGFTPGQIKTQCEGLGPVLREHVSALSLKPRDEVLAGMSSFVLASGMAPGQLAGTAKVCLGVGYTADDMDVAIGSALILAALGDRAYAELPGQHLMAGIGAAKRPDLALAWFDMSAEAGTAQAFAPGMADRSTLIRKAAYEAAGRDLPGAGGAPVQAALPTFAAPATPPANP